MVTTNIRTTAPTNPDSEKKPVAVDDTVRGEIEDLKQVSHRSAVTTPFLREDPKNDSAGIVRNEAPGSATRSSIRTTTAVSVAVITKELVAITNEMDMLKAEHSEYQDQVKSEARAKSNSITYLKRGNQEGKKKIEELEGQINTLEGERDALLKTTSTSAKKNLTTKKEAKKEVQMVQAGLAARLAYASAKLVEQGTNLEKEKLKASIAEHEVGCVSKMLATSVKYNRVLHDHMTTGSQDLEALQAVHEDNLRQTQELNKKQEDATAACDRNLRSLTNSHTSVQATLQANSSLLKVELEEARYSSKRSAEGMEKATKKVLKMEQKSERLQSKYADDIENLRTEVLAAKRETIRVTAEFKRDAREDEKQRNQEILLARMLNAQNQYFNQPNNYANQSGPRTRSSHIIHQPGRNANDSNDSEDCDHALRAPTDAQREARAAATSPMEPAMFAKWSTQKVKAKLAAADLAGVHELLAAKGLGAGLGLSQITTEEQLRDELTEFWDQGLIGNIHLKSLFTLICWWKKVVFLARQRLCVRAYPEHRYTGELKRTARRNKHNSCLVLSSARHDRIIIDHPTHAL